ncbi:phosphatidylinositol 4-kinase B [Nematocida minor]|uniref:phosphatidylinositol 4-kinase B n=1 Tax=Nematocida minor TaxID=1912983 RepID=UPI00221F3594|nr:phosphatidylinositol 4-kinase B [Nematocida minor]KAI5191983.1 phosphatidylinositol 4-kinase B [Nematocida minor]
MVQEKQSWLKNVFDSEYFAFWMALTCLARYKERSIHQYMCYNILKTRKKEAITYYPQLFHLMLVEDGSLWNRPIFRMLHKISKTDRHFATILSMYSVSVADSFPSSHERYRICMDFSESIIIHGALPGKKIKEYKIKSTLYTQYLRMTYGSKVGLSPSTEHMLHQQKQFYSLPVKKEKKKKETRKVSIKAAIAALLSGLAAVTDAVQHEFLLDTAETNMAYGKRRVQYKNEAERSLARLSRESKEANFISKLNTISNSLIPIAKGMREQALITELNLMNLYLPEPICMAILCDGVSHRSILTLSVELSKTLDSATRAPFMLVYESAQEEGNKIVRSIEQNKSPMLFKEVENESTDGKQETKERIFKTAIRILSGLKELDNSAHVDLDILAIKTRVIRKIYNMHTPQYITTKGNKIEEWEDAEKEARRKSPYKEMDGWALNSIIVKTGSDMKQEQLTSQILRIIESIWKNDGIDLLLNPYKTLVTGRDSGIIETILGAKSIHQIKKQIKEKGPGYSQSIMEYYKDTWGSDLESARELFFRSLVGYSLVSYILQIKDRHNGNILIGSKGELFHIDFGFVLGTHPGFYSVESAPFKFSVEYAEIAGKERMSRFKEEFLKGFLSLRKNMDHIIILVESVSKSGGILTISQASVHSLRERFEPGLTVEEFSEHVSEIVDRGMKNVFTDIYDSLQYYTQGYCK